MSQKRIKAARRLYRQTKFENKEEVLAFAKEQGVSVRNLDVTRKLAHQISGFSEKPVRVAHNWTESGAIVLAERRMYAALGSVLFAEKPSDWFKVSKKRR